MLQSGHSAFVSPTITSRTGEIVAWITHRYSAPLAKARRQEDSAAVSSSIDVSGNCPPPPDGRRCRVRVECSPPQLEAIQVAGPHLDTSRNNRWLKVSRQ